LHDVFRVSGPLELIWTAGAYITVFSVLSLFTLKHIIAPLIGDQVDLPFITMEPGNIGVVKEFDPDVIKIMWCISAFTSFNAALGLTMQETEGLERVLRYPLAVFCFCFSGFIDVFRTSEWTPADLAEYKHMTERGRAENWECFKKFLRIGLAWQMKIVRWTVQTLWHELKRNQNIDFPNMFRRKEQEGERILSKDCDIEKKLEKESRTGNKTTVATSRVVEGWPRLPKKQDILKKIRERGGVTA